MILFVIPCGAEKATQAAPARELYRGSAFQLQLVAAEAEAEATRRDLGVEARVLILSALHGLIGPDEIVAPYDVRMDSGDSIPAAALAASAILQGITEGDEIYSMLPAAYRARLAQATELIGVGVQNVYEAAPGIGFQRGVCSSLIRTAGEELAR
jgi:hypothetical protein